MFLQKLRGGQMPIPPRPALKGVVLAWLGGVLAIGLVAYLGKLTDLPLILGSFGASCVLVFGYPDVPFSQPRNVIVGHVISAFVGLACLSVLGPTGWSLALAVGTAIAAMMVTRTVHPPAGSNPVIVFLMRPGWGFLVFPVLTGAVVLVLVALIYNNVSRKEPYPRYW